MIHENRLRVANALARGHTGRMDIIGAGHSNQVQGGNGYDEGWQYWLSRRMPMWATGFLSARENNGAGFGVGHEYSASTSAAASVGAPAELAAYALGLAPHNYLFGTVNWWDGANGFIVNGTCPLNVRDALRSEQHYGTFPAGTTRTFRPIISRAGPSSFALLVDGGLVDASTGAYGIARKDIDLPADALRDYHIQVKWAAAESPGQVPATDIFGLWWRWINTSRPYGFAYHTLTVQGGQSQRTISTGVRATPALARNYYFGDMRRHQPDRKNFLFTLVAGLNDRLELAASLGPMSFSPGDSPDAFYGNVHSYVSWAMEVWAENGWDADDECNFLIRVDHPIAMPDDPKLVSYREAARDIESHFPNVCVSDMSRHLSHDEMETRGYYLSPADKSHMSLDGYREASRREIEWLFNQRTERASSAFFDARSIRASVPGPGNVFFVRPDGSDSNDGRSWQTALASPLHKSSDGLSPAMDGDVIVISGTLSVAGTLRLADGVSLTGNGTIVCPTADTPTIEIGSRNLIRDITVDGSLGIVNSGRPVQGTVIDRVRAANGMGQFLAVTNAFADLLIQDCRSSTSGTPITIDDVPEGSLVDIVRLRAFVTGDVPAIYVSGGKVLVRDSVIQSLGSGTEVVSGELDLSATRIDADSNDVVQVGSGIVVVRDVSGSGPAGSLVVQAESAANVIDRPTGSAQNLGFYGTVATAASASDFTGDAGLPDVGTLAGSILVFLSGPNRKYPRRIDVYTPGTRRMQFLDPAFPVTPNVGDEFVILGYVK
jgi:hypothetical protein